MCAVSDDINEAFDSLLFAEDRCHREGYVEGIKTGEKMGSEEGYELGKQKGIQVGSELGFYKGFAESILALMEEDPSAKYRTMKTLETLQDMIDKFPLQEPTNEKLFEDLDRIRAKFKQASSLLNIQPGFGSKSAVMGSSF